MKTAIKIDKLVRSKRRTLALEITGDARLIVRAPLHAPLDYIEGFIRRKQDWIRRKLDEAAMRPRAAEKRFTDGEEFLHLGESCPLSIVEGGTGGIRLTDRLHLPERLLPVARAAIIKWYKKEARRIITGRVEWYAERTGLAPSRVRISSARKRWGSCGPGGSLNFSWRLVMAPLPVIDYLVVHELAHIAHPNHSKQFWNKVKSIMPDYAERDRWLKENQRFLVV